MHAKPIPFSQLKRGPLSQRALLNALAKTRYNYLEALQIYHMEGLSDWWMDNAAPYDGLCDLFLDLDSPQDPCANCPLKQLDSPRSPSACNHAWEMLFNLFDEWSTSREKDSRLEAATVLKIHEAVTSYLDDIHILQTEYRSL